jgi:hypothetical protein
MILQNGLGGLVAQGKDFFRRILSIRRNFRRGAIQKQRRGKPS